VRSKEISRRINSLCRRVRPLARDLVEAFGIPEEMLRAPELIGPARGVERAGDSPGTR
jgi:acyl-CoA oxidase